MGLPLQLLTLFRSGRKMLDVTRLVVFVLGVCASATAFAASATVAVERGQAEIDEGSGFQPLTASRAVGPGARILVRADGAAVMTYTGGCRVRLGSGRIWQVPSKAPCAEGQNLIDMTTASSVGANHPARSGLLTAPGANNTGLLLLGLGAAGIATAVIIASQDDDDDSSSP